MVDSDLHKQASEYLDRGEYTEAIALYDRCIELEPDKIVNYWYLGLSHLLQGDEIAAQTVWMSVILENASEEFDREISELVAILEREAYRQLEAKNLALFENLCEQIQEIDSDRDCSPLWLQAEAIIDNSLQEAKSLAQVGNYRDAIEKYQQLLNWNSQNAEAWQSLGMVYYQIGQYQDAFNSVIKAIKLDNSTGLYHYSIGLILEKINQTSQAIKAYQQAIALDPHVYDAYNKLGNIFYLLGQLEQAQRSYQQVISLNNSFFPAYINLGNLFLVKNWIEEAEKLYRKANELQSGRSEVIRNLELIERFKNNPVEGLRYSGDYFYQQKNYLEAINYYKQILSTPIEDISFYIQLVNCYTNTNQYEEAIKVYQKGIQYHPEARILYLSSIWLLQNCGRVEEAIAFVDRALEVFPDNLALKLEKVRLMPVVYKSESEIDLFRDRFTKNLENTVKNTFFDSPEVKKNALDSVGRRTNFYLQYQGRNDLYLQQLYGKFVHKIMAANYPQWVQSLTLAPINPGEKIRIGYISNYMRQHSVGKSTIGWLKDANRNEFELYCYYTNLSQAVDSYTQQFRHHSDAFYHIPQDEAFWGKTENLERLCQQILSDRLHILVFFDIGMDPRLTQIAALRLAPIQCVRWGHPITTGLPTIDYYLSNDLMEPDNGQEYYSEKLVRLRNIGKCYAKPAVPETRKKRQDFQLRDNAVVYLSCQSLFKYLPQHDFVFSKIAQKVPQSQFVFLSHRSSHITKIFQERLQLSFANFGLNWQDYCVILPRQNQTNYWHLNLVSDIFLDNFSWSGDNTTLEAIACNLPVVTLPGEFMRNRHAYGILQMLGVTDTIARDESNYIEIAVRLGLDTSYRQKIVTKIQSNHSRLYNDRTCVEALENFYRLAIDEYSFKA